MKTYEILYGIVVVNSKGGKTLDSYLKEDSAIKKSEEIIEHINKNKIKNMKVYLTTLEYDICKNILISELINSESELLFVS